MKFSIITVVFNNSRTIESAILSVLQQTYDQVEFIVIDGGSKDGTCEIIEAYREKISIYVSEPDHGLYDAMNKGMQMATGDVVGILNSDDLYADENVLRDVADFFSNDPSLDGVYGDITYVSKNDVTKAVRKWTSLPYYPHFFEEGNVPPHPSLFVKKHVLKEAGLFNLTYKLAADYEHMLRIFKKHSFNIRYFSRMIILMRLGGATNKSFKNIVNGNKEILRAWNNNELRIPLLLMPRRIYKRLVQYIK